MLSEEIHKTPLIKLLLPFLLGIIIQIRSGFELDIRFFILTFLFLGFITLLNSIKYISSKFHFPLIFGISTSLILFIFGIVISSSFKPSKELINISEGLIVVELAEIPSEKEKSIKAIVDLIYLQQNNSWHETSGKAIIYLQKDSLSNSLEIGDRLLFRPRFNNIETSNNPNEFNYKRYLSFHLISQQIYLRTESWRKLNSRNDNSLLIISQKIRKKVLAIYSKNGIEGNEFGVLAALTLGYKDKLDENVKRWYSSSGAMHILAVSGLHVGIIFLILNSIFFFLNKCKTCVIFKTIIIILLLWSYAFITGLSPSVLRATIMFSFVAIGMTFNRTTSIYNTLAASAFLLLLINPLIIMEVGFQLSYLAVISIVFFQPKISNIFHFDNIILHKTWSLISVSIAAQIGTFPLALYYFHQFPNYFLLTNIIVIPFAGLIIYSALFFIITSEFAIISEYCGLCVSYIIKGLNYSVEFIESLPLSISNNIYISLSQTFLIYLVIVILSTFIINKLYKTFLLLLLSIVVLLISLISSEYINVNQKKMFVYNINNVSAYNFIDGKDNILISDYDEKVEYTKLMYFVKNNWLEIGAENEKVIDLNSLMNNFSSTDNNNLIIKDRIISYYNNRFAIINDNYYNDYIAKNKLDIDYIILAANANINIEQLIKVFNFKEVIIDSSNSKQKTDNWLTECKNFNKNSYSVKNNGAFILDLRKNK